MDNNKKETLRVGEEKLESNKQGTRPGGGGGGVGGVASCAACI